VTFHGFVENASQFLGQHTVVFASQYLSILNALAEEKAVISFADFEMKYDYLIAAPFAKWIFVASTPEEIAVATMKHLPVETAATEWARQQTWQKLAAQYQNLWQKKYTSQS